MSASHYEFGSFRFDMETLELFENGERKPLAPKPAALLRALIKAAPKLITRDEAQRILWGDAQYIEPEQSLNSCVRQLRAALGESAAAPEYLETLPKRGYRFKAPATEHTSQPITAASVGKKWLAITIIPSAILVIIAIVLTGAFFSGSDMRAANNPNDRLAEHFTRASALISRNQGDDLQKALSLYEEALQIRPTSAVALAGKALMLSKLAGKPGYPKYETYNLALEFSNAVTSLTPLPDAAAAQGYVHLYGFLDPQKALSSFEESIRLDSAYAEGFVGMAAAYGALGRLGEAVNAATTATRLNPRSYSARSDRCWYFLFSDRIDEAAAACAWAIEIEANHAFSHLGAALAAREDEEKYRESLKNYLINRPLGYEAGDIRGGKLSCSAGERAALLAEAGKSSSYESASLFAMCSDIEKATIWLNNAARQGESPLLYYPYDPRFDAIRADLPDQRSLLKIVAQREPFQE